MTTDFVRVVPYTDEWPALFAVESAALCQCLPISAADIEHIGSTAVPGLTAKPIVDLMLPAHVLPSSGHWREALFDNGYAMLGAGAPGRQSFCKRGPIAVNLHILRYQGRRWRNNLALRNFLRGSPEAVVRYERAKQRALAARPLDVAAYAAAKAPMVTALIAHAITGPAHPPAA